MSSHFPVGLYLVRDKDDPYNPAAQQAVCSLFRLDGPGHTDARFELKRRQAEGGKAQVIVKIENGTEEIITVYPGGD